jgi:spermidine/putrescine transport system ATP-binding protein
MKHETDNTMIAELQTPQDQSRQFAVDVRGLQKQFGVGSAAVTALANIDVAIAENEFFTLLGPSGCGKTTLLRLIAGFDFPTDGQILLHGDDIALLPPFKRPINTVFQNYALFAHMTVAQNIGFGLKMLGTPKAEIADRVAEMLRLVQMENLKDRQTSQLSGGQQQRVALARALAPRPKVLLLDEPLSALDYKLRKDMQIELKRLQSQTGITFVFVTHDQEEALTMSDRIAVMSKGAILQVGTPNEIYNQPATRFVADFIGESNFLPAVVDAVAENTAQVTLAAGAGLQASVTAPPMVGSGVTVVVRPEHATLHEIPEPGDIAVTVTNAVFFGTDTHYHTELADGSPFVVREQNAVGATTRFVTGQKVGLSVTQGAARILRD